VRTNIDITSERQMIKTVGRIIPKTQASVRFINKGSGPEKYDVSPPGHIGNKFAAAE